MFPRAGSLRLKVKLVREGEVIEETVEQLSTCGDQNNSR